MNQRILFPEKAYVGKVVPKSKIYLHASAGNRIKRLFVDEVEKITWGYKLAPETVNLPATKKVQEVQVFGVALKNGAISSSVLEAIDRSIPSPILYVIEFHQRVCYKAAYKRPSEADKTKWVVGEYFSTDWIKSSTECKELPIALNMEQLYQEILKWLLPIKIREKETIEQMVLRAERLEIKKREVEKIKSRINREKQFNRRVEINKTLKIVQNEIEQLS